MQALNSNNIVQIALPVPLRQSFSYRVPAGEAPPKPGELVLAPFGSRELTGIVIESDQNNREFEAQQAAKIKCYIRSLEQHTQLSSELIKLCQWLADYYFHPLGEVLQSCIPPYLRQGKELKPRRYWTLSHEALGLPSNALKRSPKQQLVLNYLRDKQYVDDDDRKSLSFSSATLKALSEKGLLTQSSEPPENSGNEGLREPALELNDEQQEALKHINLQQYQSYLLHGATGSGKTEVYLQLCAKALEQNKQVLVLIPEIGLSPQTVSRFRKRFYCPIVELHSGISEAQRARNWLDAKNGRARIIIGTRLAALAPAQNIGLIIVDEEHDSAYKQQDGLRYNARDLSIYRAHQLNAPIVLGSATPSLESLNQVQAKRYQHLVLKTRAGGAVAPSMRCVDLRHQALTAGLSLESLHAVKQCLKNDQQVLIFQNRRGYAAVQLCHQCGWISECPRCSASMTLHHRPARLHCHHCDWRTRPAKQCPNCKHPELDSRGIGTEQLELSLSQAFSAYPVIRIDRDSSRSKKALAEKLALVNSGQACILVGTQMLAKGHHFKNLKLVVITDADQGFTNPDFRAMEKMGQLLMQVSGRAGREGSQGQVLLQSHRPEHPLLQLLCQRGYYSFARQLLNERQHSGLPPYSYCALFRAECKRADNASALLQLIAASYHRQFPPKPEYNLLGPMASAMEKVQDRYRFQLLINAQSRSVLKQILHAVLNDIEKHALAKRVRWSLDVDPQDSN